MAASMAFSCVIFPSSNGLMVYPRIMNNARIRTVMAIMSPPNMNVRFLIHLRSSAFFPEAMSL